MAEIPLEDLKVGDHVLLKTFTPRGTESYIGTVTKITGSPKDPNSTGRVSLKPDGKDSKGRDHVSVDAPYGTDPDEKRFRTWKITEDPEFIKAVKEAITQVAVAKGVPEDVERIISQQVGVDGKGPYTGQARRRKTRRTRRSRR
jgi:hypothetical protein